MSQQRSTPFTPEDATFSVVLHPGIDGLARSYLETYACSIDFSGQRLLHLWCEHVDDSHNIYLRVDTFKPGQLSSDALRIPHSLVLAIHGAPAQAAIGF